MSVYSLSSRRSYRTSSQKYSPSISSSKSTIDLEFKPMEEIEEKYPEFIDKSIEELKEIKSTFCENHEYDKFLILENYIEFRKRENTNYVIAVFKKWLQEGINEAAGNFDYNIDQIQSQNQILEQNISNEYQNSLRQMKEKQEKEISKINNDKSLEIDREKNRKSSEIQNLFSLSKKYAVANEIELAKQVQNEATLKQKSQFESKQFQIEKKYRNILKNTLKRHQNDEITVKQKYDSQFLSLQNQMETETEEQKKKLLVFVLFLQRKAITEGYRELIRKEKKKKLTNEITNYVTNFVFEIGKGFIFDSAES